MKKLFSILTLIACLLFASEVYAQSATKFYSGAIGRSVYTVAVKGNKAYAITSYMGCGAEWCKCTAVTANSITINGEKFTRTATALKCGGEKLPLAKASDCLVLEHENYVIISDLTTYEAPYFTGAIYEKDTKKAFSIEGTISKTQITFKATENENLQGDLYKDGTKWAGSVFGSDGGIWRPAYFKAF